MGRLAHAASPGRTGRRPRALAARGRQLLLSLGGAALASLALSASAGAVVVNMNAIGSGSSVTYNPASQSGNYGVAMVPGTQSSLASANIPTVGMAGASCPDPWLSVDFSPFGLLPSNGLCAHSIVAGQAPSTTQAGKVLKATETFVLTWDPSRLYWQTTRGYVQKFMSDVASGSGQTSSPFALLGQYGSPAGAASYSVRYGGGCIDNGSVGGSACLFGSSSPHGPGYDYNAPTPASSTCTGSPGGTSQWAEDPAGGWGPGANTLCITDSEIQAELQRMVPQTGMLSHVISGFKPLVVVLTPPDAVDCVDSAETLCSAQGGSSAKFCSYHGQVTMPDGSALPYVVQPWTASWDQDPSKYPQLATYGCDEPDYVTAPIPVDPVPDATTLANDVGERLVSPLSQALMAAITDPSFTGWFANDGTEINDHGCVPAGKGLDNATVGGSLYVLQREFNNGGVLASDPNALKCSPVAVLVPSFVAPSAVNQGDEVQLDGSATATTLLVPAAGYVWDFGDGTPKASGPSVVHAFAKAGTYTVTLKVTDRGGNSASLSQVITVLTSSGQPAPPPSTGGTGGGTGAGPGGAKPLSVHLQLMPESLRGALTWGLRLRVRSNQSANGLVTVSISRQVARRLHIPTGRAATVVIGRGTVSQIVNGTTTLRLGLSHKMALRLRALRHVTLTVKLALVPAGGQRKTIVIAGRY